MACVLRKSSKSMYENMKTFSKNKQSWAYGLSVQPVRNSKCVYTFEVPRILLKTDKINAQRCTYFPSLSLPSFASCFVCLAHTLSSNPADVWTKFRQLEDEPFHEFNLPLKSLTKTAICAPENISNSATNFPHSSISSSGKGDQIGMEHFARTREGKG